MTWGERRGIQWLATYAFVAGLAAYVGFCIVSLLGHGGWSDTLYKTGFVLCMASSTYWTISFMGSDRREDQVPLPQVGDRVSIAGREGVVLHVMITGTEAKKADQATVV
jgi:hypothetical protein